jgi:hypothetical protein
VTFSSPAYSAPLGSFKGCIINDTERVGTPTRLGAVDLQCQRPVVDVLDLTDLAGRRNGLAAL